MSEDEIKLSFKCGVQLLVVVREIHIVPLTHILFDG